MQAKSLGHVCRNTNVHPGLIVKCAALRMGLRPCRQEKICLDEMDGFAG